MDERKTKIDFALDLMERLDFPADCIGYFRLLETSYFLTGPYAGELCSLQEAYMADSLPVDGALNRLKEIAAEIDVPYRSLYQLFYLNCACDLYALYRQRGISAVIFYTSITDLRCKLFYCRVVGGVGGNDTDGWSDGFFKLDRFALGRLQYEQRTFPHEDYVCGDAVLRQGDPVLNTHIPSAGPFPRALRYESYRRAYEFYPQIRCGGKYLPIICNSWLLFPDHEKFLPQTSNILDFMRDFDIIKSRYAEQPQASWRIFGRHFEDSFDTLPRDTSLRRAYADWLIAGNNTGSGHGLILFDGEKIVNNARGE